MEVNEIIKKIQELVQPDKISEYNLFQVNREKKTYYGIDSNNNISFLVESSTPNIHSIVQETRYLSFGFNVEASILFDGKCSDKKVHILTCTSDLDNDIKAFITLTEAFQSYIEDNQPFVMNELFSSLINLFDNDTTRNNNELQGFFAELYIIYYFKQKGIDIVKDWQKKEKMKFDFSINEQKKLEIKSTVKENRIHHFKHEQLLSDLYDIVIGSCLLRESDTGISLYELILKIKAYASNNYKALLYIENFIKNISEEELKNMKYDEIYLKDNIRFYSADMVPRFNEKTPEGVSKAEYDSDLSNVISLSENDIIKWLKEK